MSYVHLTDFRANKTLVKSLMPSKVILRRLKVYGVFTLCFILGLCAASHTLLLDQLCAERFNIAQAPKVGDVRITSFFEQFSCLR